ncbi:MAG TPA: LapA family protein [Stenomitos sp.]
MKTITNLLTSIILSAWIAAIAILSVQNFTPISLKFLVFQTIPIPLGIILAFSVGIGAMAGAIAPVLWQLADGQRERYYAEDEDF